MTEATDELVRYRMQRAEEAMEDVRILADAGRWNTCVNRLYYSCFYAISALLIRDGLSSAKHTGIRGLFNQNFVKTGKVPKNLARLYNDLFERRKEADYVDFIVFKADQVEPLISGTEAFLKYVAALLEDSHK